MRIRICILTLGIALIALIPLLLPGQALPESLHPMATHAPQGCRILLNGYAPDEWNGGYGHYDLSFIAPESVPLQYGLGELFLECSELTLSYGPTDGDASPARVNLYPRTRSDHIPAHRLVVYDDLPMEAFHAFMDWFAGEFAAWDRTADGYLVFRVMDEAYDTYSLYGGRNCLSTALYMLDRVPGVHEEHRNPCAALVERLQMSLG